MTSRFRRRRLGATWILASLILIVSSWLSNLIYREKIVFAASNKGNLTEKDDLKSDMALQTPSAEKENKNASLFISCGGFLE